MASITAKDSYNLFDILPGRWLEILIPLPKAIRELAYRPSCRVESIFQIGFGVSFHQLNRG